MTGKRIAAAVALAVAAAVGLSMAAVAGTRPPAHHGGGAAPPVHAVPLSPAEQSILYEAEQVALGNCLRSHGFDYWPEPQPQPTVFDLFPYVIDDVAWAQAHGFGLDQAAEQRLASDDPNARYAASLSSRRGREMAVAVNGNGPSDPGVVITLPTGQTVGHSLYGCTAASEGELYGSFATWYRTENIADALPSLWQADVFQDQRFGTAVVRWSRCMSDKGEAYATPQAAAEAFTNPAATPSRSLAVRVAVAEATCADSSGLAVVAKSLDTRYRDSVEARYRDVVTAYYSLERDALPRARVLLMPK